MKSNHARCFRTALFTVIAMAPMLAGAVCRTNPGGQACTLIAIPSVVLNIRDAQNAPIAHATVVFTRNFDPPVTITCDNNCDSVVLAWEQPGHFEYRVTAGGYVAASGEADVYLEPTGCHVDGKSATVVLQRDTTIGVLFGVWTSTNIAGQSTILRFDENGAPIGAILTKRLNTGDGNVYVQFNDKKITGVTGQSIVTSQAPFPSRLDTIVDWNVLVGGIAIGFENAILAADFNSLAGSLIGSNVTYTRVYAIPPALRTPG